MRNPRLAARYAKSIIGLAIERNELEKVFEDMQYLQGLVKTSPEFAMLLKSPVVAADKKQLVLDALTKGKVGTLTAGFNKLLITKGREANLPEIITAFIEQYRNFKNIYSIKLTTAGPVSDELKSQIVEKVKSETGYQQIELTAEVKEDIIGGFLLQIGDTLVDASISYDLNAIRKQFLNNDFVYNIR